MNKPKNIKSEFVHDGTKYVFERMIGKDTAQYLSVGEHAGYEAVCPIETVQKLGDEKPFGWCNICKGYCYGDCEANGVKPEKDTITFAPFQKGDTASTYKI